METDGDHHVRGCGFSQEGVSTLGCREGHGSEKVPERGTPGVAGVHQADTQWEAGLEGTFQLSPQHVQRPRMFIPW